MQRFSSVCCSRQGQNPPFFCITLCIRSTSLLSGFKLTFPGKFITNHSHAELTVILKSVFRQYNLKSFFEVNTNKSNIPHVY